MEKEYVDYAYYQKSFGGELDESMFNKSLKWATAKVNQLTFGRISRLDEIPECVKDAICAAIEKYATQEKKAASMVKSETNDGYSISYATPASDEDFNSEVKRCIKMYLSGTGLTYLGTSPLYDVKGGDDSG